MRRGTLTERKSLMMAEEKSTAAADHRKEGIR